MADIIPFLRDSWKHLWKQNIIWLFSALPLLTQLLPEFQAKQEANFSLFCLALLAIIANLVLYLAGLIGVPYIAYRFLIGNPATIKETLFAIRKYLLRVLGCSCLFLFIGIPLFFFIAVILFGSPNEFPRNLSKITLAFLPLSIFSAVLHFTMFGFFAKDLNLKQSFTESWRLFAKHFGVLATLGISLAITFLIISAASGALTVLIQSGFDLKSLGSINYINPSMTLKENLLFTTINGITQIILAPFNSFVHLLAYLKYNGGTT